MDAPTPVVLAWRKSTRSGSGNCVEIAEWLDGVAVRDSKDPHGSVLTFPADAWAAFLRGAKDGRFF